jgi:hypothetical protein
MRTTEKIRAYYRMIEAIDYNNREGGKYAYVQFLSLTREVLILLQPVSRVQKYREAIESINWVFNEYLTSSFSDHQRLIFDSKRRELRTIVDKLTEELLLLEEKKIDNSIFLKAEGVAQS